MIGQMKTLLRVKELKESQAFRTVQLKRRQVEEGKATVEQASDVVQDSKRSYASREDAIYGEILGQVVALDALDDTRGKVVSLEQSHARLVDALDRATHVLDRLDKELDAAKDAHKAASKQKDKYGIITEDMRRKAASEADRKLEGEVEELFGSRRRPEP